MGKLVDFILALIAYVCTATVIAAALSFGYLWHTGRLNDEKMFRIVALLHDVDLQRIAQSHQGSEDDIPPEESSIANVIERQQVQDRNFEVKLLALQRGRQEYEHRLQLLKEQTDRYDRLAHEWQSRLRQQEQLTTQENLATVVAQLEQLRPEVAKESLMRWIEQDRMDDAILLMNKMAEAKLGKVLKAFETEEELDRLHKIHQRILTSGASKSRLQEALGELESLQGSNQQRL
jgi:hypothetical protein